MGTIFRGLFVTSVIIGLGAFQLGCSGGGHRTEYTQVQLANMLVGYLNQDGAHYDVVKAVSQQSNYAVLLNQSTGNYLAINLAGYQGGNNASDYFNSESDAGGVYYNLSSNGDGTYTDPKSGLTFSQENVISISSEKDIRKIQAKYMKHQIGVIATNLKSIGFSSDESANRVATLVYSYQAASSKREMSDKDVDVLSEKALGTSLTNIRAAVIKGDTQSLNSMLDKANKAGFGTSREDAKAKATALVLSL